jgi:multidrug efflux pump
MTTAAMILGALPLALTSGAGAENRQQIGWIIVGGMSLGTVLPLFVVPCVYFVMGYATAKKSGHDTIIHDVKPSAAPEAH